MQPLSFRQKVVLLAVMLVVGMQVLTLFPVLNLLERDSERRAARALTLAGAVFSEFINSRQQQLDTTSAVTVADFAFREAMATGDAATIRSALANHAARLGADFGAYVGTEGEVVASIVDGSVIADGDVEPLSDTLRETPPNRHSVVYVGRRAFETIRATVRTPLPIGDVVFGFEMDAALARYLNTLTGLQATFVRFRGGEPISVATTLSDEALSRSLAEIGAHGDTSADSSVEVPATSEYLTLLRSFLIGQEELYVALQLAVEEARASYLDIRRILMTIGAFSLVAALLASIWIAAMVARPVRTLAAGVRRMREGNYGDVVKAETRDEFGELAAGFNEMQFAIAEREYKISHSARHDELTGLPNRRRIIELLENLISNDTHVDVVSLSISRIDRLVVSLGQQMSDRLIRKIAEVMLANTSSRHTLGYVQGHEFLLLLVGAEHGEVEQVLNSLSRQLLGGIRVDAATFLLQLRAGVASYPEHSEHAAGLIYQAGIARLEAEVAHELVVSHQLGQEERALRQTRLIGEFPQAVENGELILHVQPKISCRSRRVRGVEALVRWEHPELGLLSPFEFVTAIEQAGSISTLTRWVLRTALAECRAWRDAGVEIGVAVNISADDLHDENLPYYLLELTKQHRIRSTDITLEITESAIMENLAKSLAVVACLHEIGFRLSIDDFGTGHSSLAQLRRLPFSELKIDRSFVRDIENGEDEALVVAMIEMARSLSLEVCVEGIEDETMIERFDTLGARYGQGYGISRPLPVAEFLAWHREWSARPAAAAATIVTPRIAVSATERGTGRRSRSVP